VRPLVVAALAIAGCQPTPAVTSPTDQTIASSLIEAGCLANDSTAVPAVHAERALNPPKAWMNCLNGGGSVAGCAVPCAR
jgi:hypothetical protein